MSRQPVGFGMVALSVLAYLAVPVHARAQNKTEVGILQNTTEILQKLDDIHNAQDALAKSDDALRGLLQQNLDAVTKLTSTISELKGAQSAQTNSITALQSAMDTGFTNAGEKLDDTRQRLNTVLGDLDKLQTTISVIQAPPPTAVAAPPAAGAAAPAAGGTTAATAAQQAFSTALNDVQNGNYRTAQGELAQFIHLYPLDPRAGDATYWLAYTLYQQKMYTDAIDQFRNVIDYYPDNDLVPDALNWRAMCFAANNQKSEAINELKALIKNYKDDEKKDQIVKLAQQELADLQKPAATIHP